MCRDGYCSDYGVRGGTGAGTDLAGRCYVACGNGNGTKLGHDLVVSPLDGSVKEETG